jgi:hypothetical protein
MHITDLILSFFIIYLATITNIIWIKKLEIRIKKIYLVLKYKKMKNKDKLLRLKIIIFFEKNSYFCLIISKINYT